MQLKQGDMWQAYEQADLFCLTTNAAVRKDGALVMGRGIALEAKQRFPDLPYQAGYKLRQLGLDFKQYSLLVLPQDPTPIGLFQVKYLWKDMADLGLIRDSVAELTRYVTDNGLQNVHLNFPGIGWGHRKYEEVLPLIQRLPDTVTVWTKGTP